jgi:polyadenylate-binding protein
VSGQVRNIYVGKLPPDLVENDLRDLFAAHGEVERVVVVRDEAGSSRGFGFVTMTSPQSVLPAVDALDGHEIGDHVIRVNVACDKGAPAPRRRY